MPEPAAPPPAPPTIDPLAPQQFVPMSPEDDPNHLLKQMISRRKPAAEKIAETPPEQPPAPPKPKPPEPAPEPKPATGLNDLIARELGFKPTKKKAEPKQEEAQPAAAAEEEVKEPEPEPPKTIVKKKAAAAPAPPDITQITTAATTAAVRALRESPKPETAPLKPEDALKPEDRHEWEVAKAMAENNPKYKDAPRVVLEHIKKSEAYAARWETQNPGKVFNPDDDDHNEFFEGLEKPWPDHEFRTAEIEMAATRVAEKNNRNADTKIKALEQDNARLELTPIIERTFLAAAGHMAKQLNVYEKLVSGTFDKLEEEDPITAGAIKTTLRPIQPLLEAIVQIDDPKGRFPIDQNNQAHQAWLQLLADKEAQYSGVESKDGKMFTSRISYERMNAAQRARHWYLTADHLASEIVEDAVKAALEYVQTEKERQKKIAISLGYLPPPDPKAITPKSAATNGSVAAEHAAAQPGVVKPASPSVGSGAKIDSKATSTPTGRAATIAAMSDILFRPGNTVS